MKRKAARQMNTDNNNSMIPFLAKVGYGAVSIGLMATYGWPLIVILLPTYYGIKAGINSPAMRDWAQRVITTDNLPKLLPAPKQQPQLPSPTTNPNKTVAISRATQRLTNELRVVDPYEHLGFWDRVRQPSPASATPTMSQAVDKRRGVNVEDRQAATLYKAFKRLPSYYHYTEVPPPPTRLSVPIGYDAETQDILWGDFDADSDQARILHAMIAGQTGSGKDALLRLWFTTLTLNNTPKQIQFVILDGKIDWLSDALATSVYMAIPPAGGMEITKIDGKRVDLAHERMAESMDWIFEEIERRSTLMRQVGAVNLNAYNKIAEKKGLEPLPMLFLIASDVGEAFDNELGMLVKQLIMKGRAYGVRMIISMQDPVGEDTKWRAQIGLVMSGYQQDPYHDNRIMGIPVGKLLVRPSQLPNPEEDDVSKGLFIVRQGSKQHIVRTAHLPEDAWFDYIDSDRFLKKWYTPQDQQSLLEEMLFSKPPTAKVNNPRNELTHKQIVAIVRYAKQGDTKTQIMQKLGFTNDKTWAAKKEAVEQVILSARGSIKV